MIWKVFTFAVVGLAFGALGWCVNDREPPITMESIEAVTPEVVPGDLVRLRFTVDRHRSCKLHVEHLLIDAQHTRAILPDLDFDALPGSLGRDSFVDQYRVPRDFALGTACYRRISTYRCNPLQAIWPIVIDRGIGRGQICFQVVAQRKETP